MIQPSFFDDERLDNLANEIIRLDSQHRLNLIAAEQNLTSAFERRWEIGKLVDENYDYIIAQCKTQRAFAETFGYTESVISNNLRGFRALRDLGCNTYEDVKRTLLAKKIDPTIRNFERLPSMLAGNLPPRDTRKYDERRLEQIESEVQQIVQRNQTVNNNEVVDLAIGVLDYTEQAQEYIKRRDPFKRQWRNEKYLEYVRRLGYDAFTGAATERPDPHHTLPDGRSAMGSKVSDVFTIPLSRTTHNAVEEGDIQLDPDFIKDALIEVMANFIMDNVK